MITCNEKDIEDWLWEHPNELVFRQHYPVEKWIARQYRVPSGIIDLLGVMSISTTVPTLVVAELKNVHIKSAALAQVCRYAADIKSALDPLTKFYDAPVIKAVISPEGIDAETQFEADALDVYVFTVDISFNAKMSGCWGWRKDYREKLNQEYEKIRQDPIFTDLYDQSWQQELNQMIPENEPNEVEK